jgi:hypothetical protein
MEVWRLTLQLADRHVFPSDIILRSGKRGKSFGNGKRGESPFDEIGVIRIKPTKAVDFTTLRGDTDCSASPWIDEVGVGELFTVQHVLHHRWVVNICGK